MDFFKKSPYILKISKITNPSFTGTNSPTTHSTFPDCESLERHWLDWCRSSIQQSIRAAQRAASNLSATTDHGPDTHTSIHRQGGGKKGRKDSHAIPQAAPPPQVEKEPQPSAEDLPLVGLQYHLRAGQYVWYVMKGRQWGRIASTRPPSDSGTAITRPRSAAMLDVFMQWLYKTAMVAITEEGGQGKYSEGESGTD